MVEHPQAPSDRTLPGTAKQPPDASGTLFDHVHEIRVASRRTEAPRSETAPGSHYSPGETTFGVVTKLADTAALKKGVPTAAFFDMFTSHDPPSPENMPHGLPSAAAAEQHGYNVLRMERSSDTQSGFPNFGKTLTDIADAIDKGKLPLGKGDVLNMSWNSLNEFNVFRNPPTYETANRILGMKLTPENLKQNIPEILKKMKQIADRHSPMSAEFGESMKEMVQANAAIDRIQKHGVEVVNSAGDGGPTQIDLGFLKAKTHLSGLDESGKRMWGSPQDSTDTPALSVYPLFYDKPDPAHPTQYPAGSYRLGNTDVRLDAKDLGGVPQDPHYFFKNANNLYEPVPKGNWPDVPKGPFSLDKDPVGAAEGTSYANIDYLARNYQRLLALKQHR